MIPRLTIAHSHVVLKVQTHPFVQRSLTVPKCLIVSQPSHSGGLTEIHPWAICNLMRAQALPLLPTSKVKILSKST